MGGGEGLRPLCHRNIRNVAGEMSCIAKTSEHNRGVENEVVGTAARFFSHIARRPVMCCLLKSTFPEVASMPLLSRGLMLGSITALTAIGADASAGIVVSFFDGSGLAGEAEFTLVNPTTLQVRLRNTSTGVPGGFSNS